MTQLNIKINQIIRSDRKTIALIVKPDGQLIVRAPYRATDDQIWRFVNQKEEWIRSKQDLFSQRRPVEQAKNFSNGERFWFLGESYPLEIIEPGGPSAGQKARRSACPALELNGSFRLARTAQPKAREVFTDWYREQARRVIGERVAWYAARTGLTGCKRIQISSARTRWGSCSSTGTLSFTWRLVMAPLPVIDYVVVHELVHLKEKNHGKHFWAAVEKIMPDYRARVAWLKANGYRLSL